MALYQIVHIYDVDGGFGDAIGQEDCVGVVEASEEEIEKFLQEWDKPEIYDRPYSDLWHHTVVARPVELKRLNEVTPY